MDPLELPSLDTPAPLPQRKGQRLLAVFLSAIIPGVGQWLLKDRKTASILSALFGLYLLSFMLFRLPRTFWGFIALLYVGWALHSVASALVLRRSPSVKPQFSLWWLVISIPASMFAAVLLWYLLLPISGFRVFKIAGSSMAPTMIEGDDFIADYRHYNNAAPKSGDIVIFRQEQKVLVKRVIATEGQTIIGHEGDVMVDGKLLNEPYVRHLQPQNDELSNFGPITIPHDQFFVMGDNRDLSFDSRSPSYAPVSTKDILGVPLYAYIPKDDRMGKPIK